MFVYVVSHANNGGVVKVFKNFENAKFFAAKHNLSVKQFKIVDF